MASPLLLAWGPLPFRPLSSCHTHPVGSRKMSGSQTFQLSICHKGTVYLVTRWSPRRLRSLRGEPQISVFPETPKNFERVTFHNAAATTKAHPKQSSNWAVKKEKQTNKQNFGCTSIVKQVFLFGNVPPVSTLTISHYKLCDSVALIFKNLLSSAFF